MVNLTSVEVLMAYLDSFNTNISSSDKPVANTGSSDGLSSGAIAGIVVSVAVIIIILITISAVSMYFCKYSKYKIR